MSRRCCLNWAVVALGKVGPPAAKSIPRLIALWRSRNDRKWQWYCLRGHIAGTFGSMGPKAAPAVEFLVQQIKQCPGGRPAMTYTFANIGAPAVKPLAKLLTSGDDAGARKAAADILARLGQAAAPARPSLEKAARDESDESVRKAAAKALKAVPDPAG
ncbi:MAG: HEAT repeat domain-containing protein [Phycisphaerae bacterium]